jgi:ABC-type cobalamin/Fe3+-siderophores transport system ATPase subunit
MSVPAAMADLVVERAPPLLRVAGLTKRYGEQHALAAVSFDVRAGEVLGLIGPNGAGKTTLLEALADLIPVEAGDLIWCGTPTPSTERRHDVLPARRPAALDDELLCACSHSLARSIVGPGTRSPSRSARSAGAVLRKRRRAVERLCAAAMLALRAAHAAAAPHG